MIYDPDNEVHSEAETAFERMSWENRRALFNGDVDLDDVLDDDLGIFARERLMSLVERWGDRAQI